MQVPSKSKMICASPESLCMSVNSLVGLDNHPTARKSESSLQHGRETAVLTGGTCALAAAKAHLRKSLSRMCLAVCKLSAARVSVGLAVAPVGNVLLPTR